MTSTLIPLRSVLPSSCRRSQWLSSLYFQPSYHPVGAVVRPRCGRTHQLSSPWTIRRRNKERTQAVSDHEEQAARWLGPSPPIRMGVWRIQTPDEWWYGRFFRQLSEGKWSLTYNQQQMTMTAFDQCLAALCVCVGGWWVGVVVIKVRVCVCVPEKERLL